MTFQVGRADESSRAFVALEGFFPCVRHDVSFEIVLLNEFTATDVTLIRFLPSMCPLVCGELSFGDKSSLAFIAFVRARSGAVSYTHLTLPTIYAV